MTTLDILPDSMLASAARLRAEMVRGLPENRRETYIALENIDRAILWAEQAMVNSNPEDHVPRSYPVDLADASSRSIGERMDDLEDPSDALTSMMASVHRDV